MFASFFPRPKMFVWSAVGWFFLALLVWYGFADGLAPQLSLMREAAEVAEGERAPFLNPDKVWLYQYLVLATFVFCIIWGFFDRNRWYGWAVWGSAVILLVTYFNVQIGVYLNTWYGEFFDLIQQALTDPGSVTLEEFFGQLITVFNVLVPLIMVLVLLSYFTQHYVFRWRTAMNDYYMSNWTRLRDIEGAAQRVQEDTMRFAGIVEGLGSNFVSAIMTLIAFIPLLWTLSAQITELPFLGAVPGSLVFVALISSIFGTVLLAAVGYKLPGLEFNNQKVEAAYRKELVFGEDSAERAQPMQITELYSSVRKNYFKLYFNYLYFNVFRYAYLQGANFVPLVAMAPTIVAGAITFGTFQQINQAFGRVENSFQFLVNSWTTIVELMSIHKRLRAFESRLDGDITIDPAEPALQM